VVSVISQVSIYTNRFGTGGAARRAAPLLLFLLIVGFWLSFPAHAGATLASGALSQASSLECVGEPTSAEETAKKEEAEGVKCGTQVPYGLSFAYQLEVSPDGRSAYSVAVNGDLTEYSRNPANGALTEIGCFSSLAKTEPACAVEHAEMEVAAVGDPAGIAISPDGTSAYVISQLNNTVAEFSRNPENGLLSKVGCITEESSLGECATTGAKGLFSPYGITVSPDGENVYVASFTDEAIAEFRRNTETGALTQLEAPNNCISESAASECGTTTAIGLKEAIGVVVSPDGRNLYIAAGAKEEDGDVAAFSRGAEGALEQLPGEAACISEKVAGCAAAAHLQGSEDLTISPDGKNVYANSYPTNALIELRRNESGALEQLASPNECVSTEALAGCTQVERIGGPLGLAVSPGGEDLYATSANENSVAAFKRGTEGALEQLSPESCVTDEASGCGGVEFENRIGLKFARRLTVSPDGTNVYVAGQDGHDIVELARTVKPTVSRINLTHGSTQGDQLVYIKGTGFAEGAKVLFGATEAKAVVKSATSIVAESPEAAEGTVGVTVQNEAGSSAAGPAEQFTSTDKPAVAGVSPSLASEAGQTTVTIAGSELLTATQVDFGGAPASFTVDSNQSITATSPAGSGVVDVTVHTANGISQTGAADRFTYVDGTPEGVSGLVLAGYCGSLGDRAVTLENEGQFSGPGFAFENWACEESDGTEVLLANTGPEPSLANACEVENPGKTVYASANEPNSAFSWGCYKVMPPNSPPPKEKETTKATIASNQPGSGGGGSGATTVPAPQLAVTGNVAPISGTVLVRVPGSKTFVPLASLRQIPFGTVIEATHGHVSVTTATASGGTQTGEFFEGEFVLKQGRNGMVVAELTGGSFSVCPTARERAHRAQAFAASSGKHVVRKLWANAHGSFSTRGNYAAGAVEGTEWLTEDLCEGTIIRVTRDKVAVTNLVNHRHVEVRTGHKYLAKAP
jgi:DNA-binding beta-propeller fold protein YncE